MQYLTLLLMLTLIFRLCSSTQNIHYVKPSNSSSCPFQQCLTLDQYTQQQSRYFTSGSIFIFLAGNHSVQNTTTITGRSNITLRGENGSVSNVTIICKDEVTLLCESVTDLTIEGLTFIVHSNSISHTSSALRFYSSEGILIANSTFQGSGDLNTTLARALNSTSSSVTVAGCVFEGNTGDNGGAIYADYGSNITVTASIFTGNKAQSRGGAICVSLSLLLLEGTTGNKFMQNSAGDAGGAVYCENGKLNLTANHIFHNQAYTAYFSHNRANNGGAMCILNSYALLSGAAIIFEENFADNGGGVYIVDRSTVVTNVKLLNLTGNRALKKGGGIFAHGSGLTLGETASDYHYFKENSAVDGGAIWFRSERVRLKQIKLCGTNRFDSNYVSSLKSAGGALYIYFAKFILSGTALFINNEAYYGGGIYLLGTDTVFGGTMVTLEGNSAEIGAGIFIVTSYFVTTAKQLNFIDNVAQKKGGGLRISNAATNYEVIISGNFFNNTARLCGGALYVETGYNITFKGINVKDNSGSALCLYQGDVTFSANTTIANNRGSTGGGITADTSSFLFLDHVEFINNSATLVGGAIFSVLGTPLAFNGVIVFANNTANTDGGAIYAVGTRIDINSTVDFTSNSAQNGGAMYFQTGVTLTLSKDPRTILTTSYNYAYEYGGAIYHEDSTIPTQCNFGTNDYRDIDAISMLPYCFLQLDSVIAYGPDAYVVPSSINSFYDSSGRDGSFLYGGLIDRCRMKIHNNTNDIQNSIVPYKFFKDKALTIKLIDNMTSGIASEAYQLCICMKNNELSCSGEENITVYRGQTFRVSLFALNQVRLVTSTLVTAKVSSNASVKLNQNSQILLHSCTNLTYNLYSSEKVEKLSLYPDGPCRDTGLAQVVVHVTLLPCPDGFTQLHERCVCEKRLQVYDADCIINENVYIARRAGSKFWVSALYVNISYQGLILYKTCPVEYCTNDTVNITLNDQDVQCDQNRRGKLCGECNANYSLMFGSAKCQVCSDSYLALLLPFAAAGIALVVFLSFLRLTVATGMINSIILYANIVQANKYLFFTGNNRNILTVFIAWLNLDLGFQTCFYHGMNAYAQTWLQFAFPIYVWILISLIILTSRYSIILTKLIGSNPIAVLATLLLMSYNKILKIIIEVYSSVGLDYPDNKIVTVWLKDANVPYLKSSHLALAVVTSLVFIFFFLPYTLLLLLGHKLYQLSGKKHFRWLNKIKPLLDSYYAPYKKHTRHWTGFLLLVRCALYIVFSFNSLGATTKSLLAINITFTGIVIIAWLSVLLYKSFYVNIIEASVYLNIITLSAASLANANSPALIYSLVGIVFVTMICITVYHFHLCYTAKLPIWLKIKTNILKSFKKLTATQTTVPPPPTSLPANKSSHDPHKIISKTVINLREPLLEN